MSAAVSDLGRGGLEFAEFFIGEQLHGVAFFHERAVGLDDEQMRDAASVKI